MSGIDERLLERFVSAQERIAAAAEMRANAQKTDCEKRAKILDDIFKSLKPWLHQIERQRTLGCQ